MGRKPKEFVPDDHIEEYTGGGELSHFPSTELEEDLEEDYIEEDDQIDYEFDEWED